MRGSKQILVLLIARHNLRLGSDPKRPMEKAWEMQSSRFTFGHKAMIIYRKMGIMILGWSSVLKNESTI